MVVRSMANRQRTYQWINGTLQVVDSPRHRLLEAAPRSKAADRKSPPHLGVQSWLLVFTMSSVLMVFAGLGLFAFCFVLYSLIFG